MFDKSYYEALDRAMVEALKGTAKAVILTMIGVVCYLLMQPIRLYDSICDCIATEKQSQREEAIRFQNLKRHGHI